MNKQKAYILIGLPGSGKSTWSEKKMKETNPRGIGVVSRDAIRYMINGNYKYIEEQQALITDIAAASAKAILVRGHDLIVDQINLSKDVREEVINFIKRVENDVEIHFIYMVTNGIDFLVQRRMQGGSRGEKEGYYCNVIKDMKNKFEPIGYEENWNILEDVDAEGKVVERCVKEEVDLDAETVSQEEIPLEELWNLHHTLAKYIYPRLKAFRKYHVGAPGGIGYKEGSYRSKGRYGPKYRKNLCFKLWDEMLDKMVNAFELWLSSDDWDCEVNSNEYKKRWSKIEEGFSLFTKYFDGLWW